MSVLLLAAVGAALLAFLFVERRWFLLGSLLWRLRFRDLPGGPACVVVRASGPGELRELFDFLTARIGGRCSYNHFLEAILRNEHGRQVLSCRIRTGHAQYHFRVMPVPAGYAVTGHYELAPERHSLRHYLGIGAAFTRACDDFRRHYEEWRSLKGAVPEKTPEGAG